MSAKAPGSRRDVSRKVEARDAGRRREPINRAQLKALAARQAMTAAAVRSAEARPGETPSNAPGIESEFLPRARRRATLTREQEYTYIKRDLIRLTVISVLLLALMLGVLAYLR